MTDTATILNNLALMIDLALNGQRRPPPYDFSLVVFRAKDRTYRSNFVASCKTEAMFGSFRNVAEQLGKPFAPPAPDVWQPVSTAPKDGTPVDVWIELPGWARRRVADAFWFKDAWKIIRDDFFEDVEREGAQITHWRPTPPDPRPPD